MAVEAPAPPIPGQQDLNGHDATPAPAPLDEIIVKGPAQLDLFNAGGKHPTSASLRLTGGKVGLVHGTAFEKGATVKVEVTATVVAVKQQDKVDGKTGLAMSCEQQHEARIIDVRIIS